MSLVAKNPEFRELHNYYTTRRLNPLKKMQMTSGDRRLMRRLRKKKQVTIVEAVIWAATE